MILYCIISQLASWRRRQNENEKLSLLGCGTELIPVQTAGLKRLPINNLHQKGNNCRAWLDTQLINVIYTCLIFILLVIVELENEVKLWCVIIACWRWSSRVIMYVHGVFFVCLLAQFLMNHSMEWIETLKKKKHFTSIPKLLTFGVRQTQDGHYSKLTLANTKMAII